MRTPFTFFLFICCFHLTFEAMRSTVDLYVKGVKFTFNEKYQSNLKFVLKASRSKPTGLIQFSVYQLSPIINILIDIHLFYRYGTIYRNYLIIKEGVELCELYKDMKDRKPRYQNALAELFRLGTSLCSKQLSKGCPYPAGWYNLTNVDINGTISPLLPSIVPAGHYKFNMRLYYLDNSTLNTLETHFYVKPNHANRAGDFSMLNMV